MGKRTAKTTLTFSVTLPMPSGTNIPLVREYIRTAIQYYNDMADNDCPFTPDEMEKIKVHLTNKEVKYG